MILDSGDAIYVWIGQGATQEEKDASLKMTEVLCHATGNLNCIIHIHIYISQIST